MGAGCVLCDDVLRRRIRTCVLSVSSMVGRLIPALCTSRKKKHNYSGPKDYYYYYVATSDMHVYTGESQLL